MSEEQKFNIVGIGEILWDLLPSGKKLGGAPANFAYISKQLGNNAVVLSRVGDDEFGREIIEELKAKDISTDFIQIDEEKPTGTVEVGFKDGQPEYKIAENAAWDNLELTETWCEIAAKTHAVCFGSLAQRNKVSARTIRDFVNFIPKLRVFDANLRGNYYSLPILGKSLNTATVVKLNHEELPIINEFFGIRKLNPIKAAKDLISMFGLKMVCITRGENGSILVTKGADSVHEGFKTDVKDTVGAGDAFTATLIDGILRGLRLDEINERANRIGTFVASQEGAMPEFSKEEKL